MRRETRIGLSISWGPTGKIRLFSQTSVPRHAFQRTPPQVTVGHPVRVAEHLQQSSFPTRKQSKVELLRPNSCGEDSQPACGQPAACAAQRNRPALLTVALA